MYHSLRLINKECLFLKIRQGGGARVSARIKHAHAQEREPIGIKPSALADAQPHGSPWRCGHLCWHLSPAYPHSHVHFAAALQTPCPEQAK